MAMTKDDRKMAGIVSKKPIRNPFFINKSAYFDIPKARGGQEIKDRLTLEVPMGKLEIFYNPDMMTPLFSMEGGES